MTMLAEPAWRMVVLTPLPACASVLNLPETAFLTWFSQRQDPHSVLALLNYPQVRQENGLSTRFCRQKQAFEQRGCGQAAAYPQDQMCKNTFTEDKPFFLQHPCKPDTILVQPVRAAVNR